MTKREATLTSRTGLDAASFAQPALFLRDLPLSHLETLFAVAETGSFRRAAEKLNLNQSVVSRRVRKIEDFSGVSMFERSASGSTLTTAGDSFIRDGQRVLRHLDTALAEARLAGAGSTGRLRIGLSTSVIEEAMSHVIETFSLRHPRVSLSFLQGDQSELFTGLSHRRIDVVFSYGRPSYADTDGLLIGEEEVCLVLPADAGEAQRHQWDGSKNETFLIGNYVPLDAVESHIHRRALMRGSRAKIERMELDRDGVIALVGLGLGKGLVTNASRDFSHPKVQLVPFEDRRCRVPISLSWRPENDNPALRRLISLARIEARTSAAASSASRSRDRSS